jgi:hypothetical protein
MFSRGAEAAERSGAQTSARGPLPVAALALVSYGAYAAISIARHGADSFALVASDRLFQSRVSATIDGYAHVTSATGYDGQYYLFFALDPLRAWHYFDAPLYRSTHVLYPLLARAVVLGDPSAIPYALVAVNVIAVAAGTFIVGSYLSRHGYSPWLASLYFLFPGLYKPFTFDLGEPLAAALVASGLWFLTESDSARAFAGSVAAFALAGVTRETTLMVPVVLAVAGLVNIGPVRGARRSVVLLVGALAPYFALRLGLSVWLHANPDQSPDTFSVFPFGGLIDATQSDLLVIVGVALAGLMLFAATVIALHLQPRNALLIALAVSLLANVVFLNKVSYGGYNAAGRLQLGAVVLAFWSVMALQASALSARFLRIALVAAYLPMAIYALDVTVTGFRPQ